MAVTVPNRALLDRLADRDIALVSFGAGKCMTAGWGAIALTRDRDLASELRSLRDSTLEAETGRLRFTRSTRILVQTSMYSRPLYGPARRLHDVRSGFARPAALPKRNGPDGPSAGYWRLPSTRLDRNLIHHNLSGAATFESKRLADARRYRGNLAGSTSIRVPPCSENALSHFTVRVSGDRRNQIRSCLWKAGVDTGTYFAFPPFLSKDVYPNAHRLASEVLNLPLGEGIDVNDIDRISEVLIRCADDHQH
jgi:dTDP-4-amino-4,6-dideoxygalactose transaminase